LIFIRKIKIELQYERNRKVTKRHDESGRKKKLFDDPNIFSRRKKRLNNFYIFIYIILFCRILNHPKSRFKKKKKTIISFLIVVAEGLTGLVMLELMA